MGAAVLQHERGVDELRHGLSGRVDGAATGRANYIAVVGWRQADEYTDCGHLRICGTTFGLLLDDATGARYAVDVLQR